MRYRHQLLSQEPVDITPTNKGSFLWSQAKNINDFENEFSLKKVSVKGMFDFNSEFSVEKNQNGEKGVEIITPFYTHLNEKGEECGILVNRGWVPLDLHGMKMTYTGVGAGTIVGLLYRGDAKTKYSLPNEPIIDRFTTVEPSDFALLAKMNNREEASKFMLL